MSVYRQSRRAENTCPRCMETLLASGRDGVTYCEKCGGVFANIAVSTRILDAMDRQLLAIGFDVAQGKQRPRDDGRALTCPECQIDMVKSRIESAACDIDACPVHGTWFDTGEMVDVIRAFESARKKGLHRMGLDRPSVPVNLKTEDEPATPGVLGLVDAWLTR